MKCPKCGSENIIPFIRWSPYDYECMCGHYFNKKDD